jgi:hypothetical protein
MASEAVLSDQLCECGCGRRVPVARKTHKRSGHVKGEPMRFLKGHARRVERLPEMNPSGLCMCGCGRRAPLAPQGSRARGWVKGMPQRYIRGHAKRRPKPKLLLVVVDGECWVLPRQKDRPVLRDASGQSRGAHKLIYELARGAVPADLELHHGCENRRCINPGHLEALTHAEHMKRH